MKPPMIYVIENDLISVFHTKIKLHQSNLPCKIKVFDSVVTASEMLKSNYKHVDGPPDIMLVNFDLPGLNGISFLENLEENGLLSQNILLYIFSSYVVPDEKQNYEGSHRIEAYFTKPLTRENILAIFNRYEEKAKERQISA